jgi:hypothetical protein
VRIGAGLGDCNVVEARTTGGFEEDLVDSGTFELIKWANDGFGFRLTIRAGKLQLIYMSIPWTVGVVRNVMIR